MQLTARDAFVALAIALVSIRFNFMVNREILPEQLVEDIKNDRFISSIALFAVMFLASGQNPWRAFIAFVLFAAMMVSNDLALVRVAAAAFVLVAICVPAARKPAPDTPMLRSSGGWVARRRSHGASAGRG